MDLQVPERAGKALDDIMRHLPGWDNVTYDQKERALENAFIPDSAGKFPYDEEYVSTVDVYFAAYILVGFLEILPQVTQVSSEGTSVTTSPSDWKAFRWHLTVNSVVLSEQSDGFGSIEVSPSYTVDTVFLGE